MHGAAPWPCRSLRMGGRRRRADVLCLVGAAGTAALVHTVSGSSRSWTYPTQLVRHSVQTASLDEATALRSRSRTGSSFITRHVPSQRALAAFALLAAGSLCARSRTAVVNASVRRQARGGAGEAENPPAVIVGGGRVGEALAAMGPGSDIIVRRGDAFPADAPPGPIYVCTRNDALKGVIEMTPPERREDLVFIQNGALLPFLEGELGKESPFTVLLVYFAVAKKGDPPLDGKTDTDPDGLSAVNAAGKWSNAVATRLNGANLACRVLPGSEFAQAYWEKNIWIAAYMLVGALNDGCTVGEVESAHRAKVDAMVCDLAKAVMAVNADIQWDLSTLAERLAAYARSVAHFPTAVKEFEWRNGAFYDLTVEAEKAGRPDPCPLHTDGLRKVGKLPAPA